MSGAIRVDWPTFLGAVFFLLIGGGFAVFGAYQLSTTRAFVRNAAMVPATVLANVESCDDEDCTWWPTFGFSDSRGRLHEMRTRHGASTYGWREGEVIGALYNPNYAYVRIPGFGNLYLLGTAFLLIGLLPVCIAVWLLARHTFTRDARGP
ncbi:hypothetical protein [Pseudooceanicola sp. LIPI14-2-Ac024]|uniref:hypothetical protein n=1 Tax=Pseudooceanicola sp. LIPI14-2-Ac024 TaxID=3344875 RepID=UPI0035CF5E77